MQPKLKIHHWIISLLAILIGLFLFVGFGWSAFATMIGKQGLNGSMHSYYNLTRIQFTIFTGLVSLSGLCTSSLLSFYLLKRDAKKVITVLWLFLVIIFLIYVCEIYLQTRFIGKG